MKDVPQPAEQPYEIGEVVEIQTPEKDGDARFDGYVCEVVDILKDDFDDLTERELDRMSYQLRPVDGDGPLPVWFRHFDIVPSGEQNTES
jgi:hypothetical protein